MCIYIIFFSKTAGEGCLRIAWELNHLMIQSSNDYFITNSWIFSILLHNYVTYMNDALTLWRIIVKNIHDPFVCIGMRWLWATMRSPVCPFRPFLSTSHCALFHIVFKHFIHSYMSINNVSLYFCLSWFYIGGLTFYSCILFSLSVWCLNRSPTSPHLCSCRLSFSLLYCWFFMVWSCHVLYSSSSRANRMAPAWFLTDRKSRLLLLPILFYFFSFFLKHVRTGEHIVKKVLKTHM